MAAPCSCRHDEHGVKAFTEDHQERRQHRHTQILATRPGTDAPTVGVPRSVDGWAAEPKLDGWLGRMLVDAEGAAVRTRRGRDIT